MEGLAASMVGGQPPQQPQPRQAEGVPAGMPSLEEVIALLMQGVDPMELERMGIPQEMILQAIDILEQQLLAEQQQQQQAAMAQENSNNGLAQQMVGM